jgi:hypothetical protein
MFLSVNLRKTGEWVGGQSALTHTWAALHTSVLADLAATEQGRQTHVAAWADEARSRLAWAADWALGRVALEHGADVCGALDVMDAHTWHTGGVLATSRTGVLACLAHQLGADWAGDVNVSVSVLDVHGGTGWVLVVLDLGGVLDALGGLDDVLTGRRLEDDATLHVHEGGWLGGGRGSHLVCNSWREINYTQHFQRLPQVLQVMKVVMGSEEKESVRRGCKERVTNKTHRQRSESASGSTWS